jgi:Bacterial PH domain
MGQIDRLLAPGERVHLVSREHGVVLLPPFLRAAMIVVASAAAAILAAGLGALGPVRLVLAVLAAFAAAHALLQLARAVGRWQRRLLVVTNHRAVLLAGGLGQRMAVFPLSAINDIEIVRPAAGRVLHYGGVLVGGGGGRGLLFGLRRLPDPDLLLGLLLGLADERTDVRPRWAPAAIAPSGLYR